MEWLIGSLLIPLGVFIYKLVRNYQSDSAMKEARLADLTTRVSLVEQKVAGIEGDIVEIKELRDDISDIKQDLRVALVLLEERKRVP